MEFDPAAYKATTRDQWDDAAEAWHRWGPVIESWMGEATERMLTAAGIGEGSQVLDVAGGAGGQGLAAARRTGHTGRVVVTDLSPAIVGYAARSAAEAGLRQVQTVTADGEALDGFPDDSFDAVICRLGLMFFPDRVGALMGMRRTLREGGRVAVVVYTTPDRNGFFSIPISIIRERAKLPAPQPGLPGPFSLGTPGALESALTTAGLRDVAVTALPAPLRLSSAAECVRFEKESFAALREMLSTLPDAERARAWDEIEQEFTRFETGDGFTGPCEVLIGSGTR